jgi:uncharacterized OB-fold protein
MGIVLFFALSLIVAAAIIYPLLPGRAAAAKPPASGRKIWTDLRIEAAVRRIHETRSRTNLTCPACGRAYQAGDGYCVRCGAGLPQEEPAPGGQICPSCGSVLRPGDVFCSRCGYRLHGEEVS